MIAMRHKDVGRLPYHGLPARAKDATRKDNPMWFHRFRTGWKPVIRVAPLAALFLLLAACDNMKEQPRYDSEQQSAFWPDGTSARPLPAGTVARGFARTNEHLFRGTVNGQVTNDPPFPITLADLERGQQRYDIYCTPCHDYTGSGNGMIVQRGLTAPPSYHIQRLKEAPLGHFYQVMTDGWGAMYSYAARVTPQDRWRIAAYIRALQLSQDVKVSQLSPEDQQKLKEAK